jgi:hypothetical protein
MAVSAYFPLDQLDSNTNPRKLAARVALATRNSKDNPRGAGQRRRCVEMRKRAVTMRTDKRESPQGLRPFGMTRPRSTEFGGLTRDWRVNESRTRASRGTKRGLQFDSIASAARSAPRSNEFLLQAYQLDVQSRWPWGVQLSGFHGRLRAVDQWGQHETAKRGVFMCSTN